MKAAPIEVSYVDHMGDDLRVVNVARVSFDKESEWEIQVDDDVIEEYSDISKPIKVHEVLSLGDHRLISYLARHNHWSPFAHCFLSFRIKAPLFVARQLVKHQVGLSWNEVSRRYVDSEPEFYFPDFFRGRAENVKQGSADTPVDHPNNAMTYAKYITEQALNSYQYLLDCGVAPEQARMVLPLNTHTEWIWSGSLMAFARVCKQRLDPHAQKECREVAQLINDIAKEHFPVAWEALSGN